MISALVLLLILLLVIALGVALSSMRRVRSGQVGVIERLSAYHRTLRPGLHFVLPGDSLRLVDVGEQTRRLSVSMVSGDQQPMSADVDLSYRVVDPRAATYEIADYALGVEQLARTGLRAEAGAMDAETLLASDGQVTQRLQQVLTEAVTKWGLEVGVDVALRRAREQ